MKKLLTSAIATVCLMTIIASCSKTNNVTPTPTQNATQPQIVGIWRVTDQGQDNNNNGTIESSEKYPLDTSENSVLTFNQNGTTRHKYTNSDVPILNFDENGTWTLINNNQEIRIISSSSDTTYLIIKSVTSNNLVLVDPDQAILPWFFMTRQ